MSKLSPLGKFRSTRMIIGKARKPHTCVGCQGEILVKDECYRPLMDGQDGELTRPDRVCLECMEAKGYDFLRGFKF